MRWMSGITDAMDMDLGKLREMMRDRGGLACCRPWGCKESDMIGQLNNVSLNGSPLVTGRKTEQGGTDADEEVAVGVGVGGVLILLISAHF